MTINFWMGQTVIQPRLQSSPPQQAGPAFLQSIVPTGVSNVQSLGFLILIAFVFMIFSRVFDMHFTSFHIPGVSERIMAVVVILSGSFWRPFNTAIGKRLLWFTAWMVLGVPFSVWRSDSLSILTSSWWPCLIVFMAVAGLIEDYTQYRRIAFTMAFAILVLSILCLRYGNMDTGRLWMANRSRFANPNEMAQAMLIGIPFWLAMCKRSSALPSKLATGAVLLLMVYIIAKTGSRGALISFAALYLAMLIHASTIGKAGLLLAASLSICAALAFLPSNLKDRYKTLFSEDKPEIEDVAEDQLLVSAVSSTASREHLLRQSLILTATHPIFGVGVGQFMVAENALAVSQGQRRGSWLGTHNTYMQVASETGLPGAFLFISMLLISLRMTHSLYTSTRNEPELKEISSQAEALFFSLICLATTDMFIHVPYTMLLPVLGGMGISLEYTSRPMIAEVRRRKAEAALPVATVRQVSPGPVPVARPADLLPST